MPEGLGQLVPLFFKGLDEGVRLALKPLQSRGRQFRQSLLVLGAPQLEAGLHLPVGCFELSRGLLGGSTDRIRGRVGAVFKSCRFLQEGLGHLAATLFEALKESLGLTLEPLRALARQFRESHLVGSHAMFQADLRLLPYRLQTGRGVLDCAVDGIHSRERASGDPLSFFGQRLQRGLR